MNAIVAHLLRLLRSEAEILPVVLFAATGLLSCRSSPKIQYYQPEVIKKELRTEASGGDSPEVVLGIEDFSANAAYDEQRLVYRENNVQLNYYHYHRWAASPGRLVSDALQQIYRSTDRFDSVISGYDSRSDVVLSGRVVRFEEFDLSDKDWQTRVVLSMQLRDTVTGDLLWDEHVTEHVSVEEKTPVGVARGVSIALTRIGSRTAEQIAKLGREARRRARKRQTSGAESSPDADSDEGATQ